MQRFHLVGSKRSDSALQPTLIDSAYLVGSYLAVTPHDATAHTIRIPMNSRCDGNDNHRVEMVVQLLGTDNDARTNLLHFSTDGGVQINPIDIGLTISSPSSSHLQTHRRPSACPRRPDGPAGLPQPNRYGFHYYVDA